MLVQHRRISLVAAVGVLVTLTVGWSVAAPRPDPSVCSTNGGGVVQLTREYRPESSSEASADRSAPWLLKQYPAFDYWNLDTGAVRDSVGLMHFAVRLWQYNNYTLDFDRFVVNPAGQVVETWLNWRGVGNLPVFTDTNGRHNFPRPCGATQQFGVVDSANNIHVFNTSAQPTGWEVHYTKLDAHGATVIPWAVLTTGADCWNWYLQPVITSDDRIIVTWVRSTQDICAIESTNLGDDWTDIMVLVPNAGGAQASAIKTVLGADDSLHFVWRTLNWSTYVERLWYAKMRPDYTLAIDQTIVHEGPVWYAYVSMDDQDSLHVTFGLSYELTTDMYYTRLRGDLDLGGASGTDALLTALPERMFLADPRTAHYPVNLVDENGAVHVIYEVGDYGCLTDKDLYYVALCTLDGDLDCDEAVDFDDFDHVDNVLGGPDNPRPAGSDPTDFAKVDRDDDGDADLVDFAAFQPLCGGGR